jgi:outer membrane protein assembly factor BamB
LRPFWNAELSSPFTGKHFGGQVSAPFFPGQANYLTMECEKGFCFSIVLSKSPFKMSRMRFNPKISGALFLLLLLPFLSARADDWPQWLGQNGDSVWREKGILKKFPARGPKILWRTAIGGGYAGPAVARGNVFVADRQLAEGANNPADPFARGIIKGTERIVCLNEADGKINWKHEYDAPYSMSYPAGPRVTPLVSEGKVYSMGAEGTLCCLNASDGKLLWSREARKDFAAKTPMWGFACHPLLDGDRLICVMGGDNALLVALNKDTGKEIWRSLSAKEPGYSSPIICDAQGTRQLVFWSPESVSSLNPETGKTNWSVPFTSKMGMSLATPRYDDSRLLCTAFYSGALMLRLNKSTETPVTIWRTQKASEKETTHLNAVMCTPFLENGYIYGVCSYGQLRCLKADSGERLWETFQATTGGEPVRWANAFIVKAKENGHFFLFNEKGDLIIADLTPEGYKELSRAHLLDPTNTAAGRDVLWSHPAFANRHIYARNDREIICADLGR